ncbi:MAG: hypothetical protein M1818_001981 [Claussenomyces sp. TS43310]|nr:MAG: hypothetical protein M1818_001981 [Claussenomyces sp. TS43310]
MSSRTPWAIDPRTNRVEEGTTQTLPSDHTENKKMNGHAQSPEQVLADSGSPKTDRNVMQRRRLVFTDPVAFRYLEEEAGSVVLERRGRLSGYEMYLVEQWACSRVNPTFVITTYTGDPNHYVLVGVLGVPIDEEMWSPRLRVYFKSISQFHARPKETIFGTLMVTDLSSFPSALTVIPVPDGDVRKHREDFIVNEDLKRLGCSGRSGLSLSAPAGATQAKFHQLYRTSDSVPLYSAVIELVKFCQVSLIMFGKLEQQYADGLLCDITEKAINDWWTEMGYEYYNVEPSDGILGPTTVAALLGMLMGARNRLNYYGAPVGKDAFDVASLKRGIAYFQKSQKLERTRRLDRETLDKLHRVTAKAAAGEGWAVPKAVKSTVVELSGKGGDMVMGMVGGGRDKGSIGDVETLDIDRFIRLVHGERSKWLWYGKVRRGGVSETLGKSIPEMGNRIFSKDDQGGYAWTRKRGESFTTPEDDTELRHRDSEHGVYAARPPGSAISMGDNPSDRDQHPRKTVFKSVTDKMSDARSGFGRIKDAVGLRGHASKHSRDDSAGVNAQHGAYFSPNDSIESASARLSNPAPLGQAFTWKNKPQEYENGHRKDLNLLTTTTSTVQQRESESPPSDSRSSLPYTAESVREGGSTKEPDVESKWSAQVKDIRRDLAATELSVAGSVYGDRDLEGPLSEAQRDSRDPGAFLYRRRSVSGMPPFLDHACHHEDWWPRHMSFSDVEEVVLPWDDIDMSDDVDEGADSWAALQAQTSRVEHLKRLHARVSALEHELGPWVGARVNGVKDIDDQALRDQDEFQTLYLRLSQAYDAVRQSADAILSEERSHTTEAIKDIEALGARVEYETNALISKVEDVEDGVRQFELQVDDVEARAGELEVQLQTEGWLHWAVRTVTGMGTGPVMND